MMIERLTTLTKSAEQRGAELTVWPESAYPFTLPHAARTSPSGSRAVLQGGVHGPVLTGAYMSGGARARLQLGDPRVAGRRARPRRTTSGTCSGSARRCRSPTGSRGCGRCSRRAPASSPGDESVVFVAGADPRRGAQLLRGHAPRGGARGDGAVAEPARQRDERRVVRGQRGGRAPPAPRGAARDRDAARSRARREPGPDDVRRRGRPRARALRPADAGDAADRRRRCSSGRRRSTCASATRRSCCSRSRRSRSPSLAAPQNADGRRLPKEGAPAISVSRG